MPFKARKNANFCGLLPIFFPFHSYPKLQICCLHGPIYPPCYSWGQLCTGSSQGDAFWEQPGSEWRICPSRKPKHYRLQGCVGWGSGGCSLATGSFGGLFTDPPPPPLWPVKISQNKIWRRVGDVGERGMKEKEKMRSNSGASLFTLCPPLLLRTVSQQPTPSYFRTEENVFLRLSEK